jgi:glucose-1-phosphate adenylyltransferase
VFAHKFRDANRKADPYWRDVGTLDAYYQANMDLVAVDPVLNLYDDDWPVRTLQPQSPPPKFVHASDGPPGVARRGGRPGQPGVRRGASSAAATSCGASCRRTSG